MRDRNPRRRRERPGRRRHDGRDRARAGDPRRPRAAGPLDGRRRAGARVLRLRVDGDRAPPRGGCRDELAGAGRAGPRPGAVSTAGRPLDDGRDADAIAYDRPPEGYYHARLLDHARGDWATAIARRYLYDTADAVRLEALADASFEPLRDLVGKIRREERYHVLHAEAWIERLATGDVESARPARWRRWSGWAPTPGRVLSPLPNDLALVMAGDPRRLAGASSTRGGGRRSRRDARRLGLPAPAPAGDPGTGPDGPLRRVPLAPRRAVERPPPRPGGRLVTAASGRAVVAGARPRARASTRRRCIDALREVAGPRDPGDLGRRPRA